MKKRLTLEDLEALIDEVEFFQPEGSTLTVCVLTLINGCSVVGQSNCIDPINYSSEIGKETARNNAREKIWELEGYAMKRAQFDLVLRAARAAHEANRIYCLTIGDNSQPVWDKAPDWQKDSAIAGVEMLMLNPKQSPEQSHNMWLAHKRSEGWKYGSEKDPDNKLHPCMVPYDELPANQRYKDVLFVRTVLAVLGD